MRVLGIDPGTINMGYGVIDQTSDRPSLAQCGVLKAPSGMAIEERLQQLYSALVEIIDEVQPDHVAIEEPFVSRNVRSAMMIGEAKAIASLAATGHSIPVSRYSPRKVKQAVSGYGGGSKEQVQEMVRLQLGLDTSPEPLDASDAIAVALCHLHQLSLGLLLAESQEGRP